MAELKLEDYEFNEEPSNNEMELDQYATPEQASGMGTFFRGLTHLPAQSFNIQQQLTGGREVPVLREPGDVRNPAANFLGENILPGAAGMKALGIGGKLLSGLNRANQLRKVGELGREEQAANQQSSNADEAHNNLASMLQEAFGTSKPESLQRQSNLARQNMGELETQPESPPKEMYPRLGDDTQRNLLPEAERAHQQSVENRQRYEQELSRALGRGETHDVALTSELIPALRANRQEIGRGYDGLEQRMSNENVSTPNTRSTQEINKDLIETIKQGGLSSPEATKLVSELSEVGSNDTIPGDVYLRATRTTRQLASDAMNKARKVGGSNADERARQEEISNNLNERADQMEKHLEENVGEDVFPELRQLNSRWRNEVRSLDKNKLHRQIQADQGLSSRNLMQALRGNSLGQRHLNNMISRSPTALRNVVGRAYADNPRGLLDLPAQEEQFVQQMPGITGLREGLRRSLQQEQEALQAAESARSRATAAEENAKQLAKMFKKDLAEENAAQTVREKNAEIIKKIENLSKEAETKKMAAKELKDSLKNKKLKLNEKIEASMKLEKARKDLDAIKKVAFNLSKLAAAGTIGIATMKTLNKIFS